MPFVVGQHKKAGQSAATACVVLDSICQPNDPSIHHTTPLTLQNDDTQACAKGRSQFSPCLQVPNTASFCSGMQRDSSGKAKMFNGQFDIISTWNPYTWTPDNPSSNQGVQAPPKLCKTGARFKIREQHIGSLSKNKYLLEKGLTTPNLSTPTTHFIQ